MNKKNKRIIVFLEQKVDNPTGMMPLYQKQQCNQRNNFQTLSISTRWDPALHTIVNLPSYLNFNCFDSGNVSHHLHKIQHKELRRASLVAQKGKSLPATWIPGFKLWVRKIPWRRKWKPTPVFLPGKVHGWRAWQTTVHGVAESDTTEWLSHTYILSLWNWKYWHTRVIFRFFGEQHLHKLCRNTMRLLFNIVWLCQWLKLLLKVH